MTLLAYEWLGFGETPQAAANIIQGTAVFYLSIAGAYLVSFLYGIWHSLCQKKLTHNHVTGILVWIFMGCGLFVSSKPFVFFINFVVTLISLGVLYHLRYTHALIIQATIDLPPSLPDDKKIQYGQIILKKATCTLKDVVGVALMNEQILWLLILYRSIITARAAYGL